MNVLNTARDERVWQVLELWVYTGNPGVRCPTRSRKSFNSELLRLVNTCNAGGARQGTKYWGGGEGGKEEKEEEKEEQKEVTWTILKTYKSKMLQTCNQLKMRSI